MVEEAQTASWRHLSLRKRRILQTTRPGGGRGDVGGMNHNAMRGEDGGEGWGWVLGGYLIIIIIIIYLVVALGVHAVVVLSVLVGAVHVAAVLASREPEDTTEQPGDESRTRTHTHTHARTRTRTHNTRTTHPRTHTHRAHAYWHL